MAIGGLGWVVLSLFDIQVTAQFKAGLVLWYVVMGSVIALQAQLHFTSLVGFDFPWWLRAFIIGSMLNFVFLFIESEIVLVSTSLFRFTHWLHHPMLFVLRGIDWLVYWFSCIT